MQLLQDPGDLLGTFVFAPDRLHHPQPLAAAKVEPMFRAAFHCRSHTISTNVGVSQRLALSSAWLPST
jgi:hypothetical protein